jgi:hypothetical protein
MFLLILIEKEPSPSENPVIQWGLRSDETVLFWVQMLFLYLLTVLKDRLLTLYYLALTFWLKLWLTSPLWVLDSEVVTFYLLK